MFITQILYGLKISHEKLPKLPIPAIKDTLDNYLKVIKPLLLKNEFNISKVLAKKVEINEADKLQELLASKASINNNWLSEWWLTHGYLRSNVCLPINVNPGILFPTFQYPFNFNRLVAKIIFAILDFKNKVLPDLNLLTYTVEQYEKTGELCMSQYYSIFNNCRIPGLINDKDTIKKSELTLQNQLPTFHNDNDDFIIVLKDKKIWKVSLTHPQDIFNSLHHIMKLTELSKMRNNCDNVNVLTTSNRSRWRQAYKELIKLDAQNQKVMELIQNCVFVLCLDPSLKPLATSTQYYNKNDNKSNEGDSLLLQMEANNILHGLGTKFNTCNRWFDKTLQVIITEDGRVGINYEHTVAEGGPYVALMNYIVKYVNDENFDNSLAKLEDQRKKDDQSKELTFVKNIIVDRAIEEAAHEIDNLISDFHLRLFQFTKFGKTVIKRLGVSPDAFIQNSRSSLFNI